MARRIIAALILILATILAPFAAGALWAERTITEPDTFTETLAPLADEPVVRQTVATEVSTALVEAIDAQARIEKALGELQGPLAQLRPDDAVIASAIASGINGAIESGVQQYTQSDRFGDLWLLVAQELQKGFMALVERDPAQAAVALQDGQLVLDTKIAVEKVQALLVERGVPFADKLEVPGRDVVLADTPNLQLAADSLRIFLPVASWLWIVVLLMFLVGALLWRPRARGVIWAGLGLALAGGVTYVALGLGQAALVSQAPSGYAALLEAVAGTMLRFLVTMLLVMVTLGIALMLGGWLAGGTRSGRKVRQMIADAAHRWGSPLADSPLGRFTSEHPMFVPTLRAVTFAGAVVYLVALDRATPVNVFWTAVLVGVVLLLIEVVEGSGLAREAQHSGAVRAEAPPAAVDEAPPAAVDEAATPTT
jgi:hypothetical protein